MIQNNFTSQSTAHPYRGIAIVVVLHLFLGWALISGTASKGLTLLMKPLEAVLIQEVAITQPPPPPPPKTSKPLASKLETPPPPFIPQAEVPTPVNAIAQIVSMPTPPAVVAAIAPTPPPAPPAVVAARTDIATICPTQIAPEMPRKAILDGTQGVIKAQATIQDGIVRAVVILSGPRIFHEAVRNAMLHYKCTSGTAEVVASQDFNFTFQ
jgi:protein TonB